MGYVSFDRFQSELLFKVIADRSERGSTIVTTNLAFSEWTNLFENTAMVAALVDRCYGSVTSTTQSPTKSTNLS